MSCLCIWSSWSCFYRISVDWSLFSFCLHQLLLWSFYVLLMYLIVMVLFLWGFSWLIIIFFLLTPTNKNNSWCNHYCLIFCFAYVFDHHVLVCMGFQLIDHSSFFCLHQLLFLLVVYFCVDAVKKMFIFFSRNYARMV